jgi:hypothetical protein
MDVAPFYSDRFDDVRHFIDGLKSSDYVPIYQTVKAFDSTTVQEGLAVAQLKITSQSMWKLEAYSMP